MVDIEYKILCYIEKNNRCYWTDVLNAFDPQTSCNFIQYVLECMVNNGTLSCSGLELSSYRLCLTPKGALAKQAYDEAKEKEAAAKREEEAKEERAQRAAERNTRIAAVSSVVSAIVSAVVSVFLSALVSFFLSA